MLGGAEGLEDCCAVAADPEGEQGAKGEAEEGADCCVGGDGAGGFAEGVAVGLLEAVVQKVVRRAAVLMCWMVAGSFVLVLHVLFCEASQLGTHGLSGHCEGFGTHGGGV